MKKLLIFMCAFCIAGLSFALTACGSTYAKIVGIRTGVVAEQDHVYSYTYGNPLSDKNTLAENDYDLQVGQNYLLAVTYVQTGGSIISAINAENITLIYDDEVLEITPPSENEEVEVFYTLTCKKRVAYAAVIVEVDKEYSETVIISAK